jgi:hypothetical protein
MWLFTRYGFFSIASASEPDRSSNQSLVMVRARAQKHLLNLQKRFPDSEIALAEILTNVGTDYKYRIVISKAAWAEVVSELTMEQTWSNFKNEASRFAHVNHESQAYARALHDVWSIMYRFQEREDQTLTRKKE